jgi:hypothetical protein
MVMFVIISITVSMVLAPTLNAYMRANDFAEYNALLDNIANQIIVDLSQSVNDEDFPVFINGVWFEENDGEFLAIKTRSRIVRYAVFNGVLQVEAVGENNAPIWRDVFSPDFYKRKLASFMIEADNPANPTAFILTVKLRENSTLGDLFEIERQYVVRPLMLN